VPVPDLGQAAALPLRILAVKLSSFGDIIHVTGALRALRRAFPRAEIHLAVESRWADVVRHNPNVDLLLEGSSRESLSPGYVAEIRRHLSNRPRFDVAIDFQGTRRSAAWIYLSRARIRFGRGRLRPGWRFCLAPGQTRHAVSICAEVCERAGIPVDNPDPEIRTCPEDEQRLDAFLDEQRIPRDGFILFHPFSRWISKSWPAEHAAAFIGRLNGGSHHELILTGDAGDREREDALLRAVPEGTVRSLVGRLPLGQALCLFRRARLMVSCDSGPMHAAAAFGVPVVALFGPTLPEHTGPWGVGHSVLQARRPPEHRAYRTDPGATYMRALDSKVVLDAVAAKLEVARGMA
jgi:ADP-heptose:LPS heptosyltransferase